MPNDVFVSHAAEDQVTATEVCAILEARGVACWIAPRDVPAGAKWDEAILDAIETSSTFLLLLSNHANNSPFVQNEVNRAFGERKPIVTFRIEDVVPGRSLQLYLARHHWTDGFPPPIEERVDRLAASIHALVGDARLSQPRSPVSIAALAVAANGRTTSVPPNIESDPRGASFKRARLGALEPTIASLRRHAPLATAFTLGVIVAAAALLFDFRRRPAPRVTRSMMALTGTAALTTITDENRHVAITPDGTRIIYVGGRGTQLFVRAMDQLESTPLNGLGFPEHPFTSPDGQWIGFFNTNGDLFKVAITGGPPVSLCSLSGYNGLGASWGPDGTIVFATSNPESGLLRIPTSGGEPTVLTRPNRERGEADHLWPEFLPGGQAVLFTITSTTGQLDKAQVAVLDLRTGAQKVLVQGASHAHYVSSGHLVYNTQGTLKAISFDLARLNIVGTPVTVVSQVVTTAVGGADFDVSLDGTLVYVAGGLQPTARVLVWVDRHGHETALKAPPRQYVYPRLSPDGTRIALDIRDQDRDIWIWNVAGETLTRLTTDPALDRFPVWTADGARVVFCSDRSGGSPNLFWQAAGGMGTPERLLESQKMQCPRAVTPDGSQLVFAEQAREATDEKRDLMVLALGKERRVQPLIQTPFNDDNAAISPDGRWLAYNSDESGRFEVYVHPFPEAKAGHWQVSNDGGIQPLWARSGRELFYRTLSGALMSVEVGRSSVWQAGAARKLLNDGYLLGNLGAAPTYDVSIDGNRFLMIKQVRSDPQDNTPPSIVVVNNWFEELKRLVPVK